MIRPIAINLPQFHPFPENDEWWGKGFTEWTNVTKAKPLFKGHYQPHLPTDLGFYDLRLEEARVAQAEMAKAHGIYGFCYYHYWFNGKRLMQRPLDDMLKTQTPDFPFMLCWANENWSRRWDGSEHSILIEQAYSEADAIAHCKFLIPFFKDKRYIKVGEKPVFCFYKPQLIPNIDKYVESFRLEGLKNGVQLYICYMENQDEFVNNDFDAAIEFQPQSKYLNPFINNLKQSSLLEKIYNKYFYKTLALFGLSQLYEKARHKAFYNLNYEDYVNFVLEKYEPQTYKRYPGVTPMWDNTARRGENSFLFREATPRKYEEWLNFHKKKFKPYSADENFVFINAWNEWAEGNHLEPCIKWGNAYLAATKRALSN